jgi:uncharacterized protein YciI
MDKPLLYIIRLTNTDMSRYDEQIDGHRAWVNKYASGPTFLFCGPLEDHTVGGAIIAQAESREALDRILAEDPFLVNGVATHEVITLVVTRGYHAHILENTEVAR